MYGKSSFGNQTTKMKKSWVGGLQCALGGGKLGESLCGDAVLLLLLLLLLLWESTGDEVLLVQRVPGVLAGVVGGGAVGFLVPALPPPVPAAPPRGGFSFGC